MPDFIPTGACDKRSCRRLVQSAIDKKMVEYAISVGGTSTGEHGVGTGKIAYLRQEHGDAVNLMAVIKNAVDPGGIMNPGKILPG